MKITFPNNQVLEGTPEKIRDQLIKVYAKAGANESQSLYEVLELIKKITPISVQEEYNGQGIIRHVYGLAEQATGKKAIQPTGGFTDERTEYQPVKVRPSLPKAPKLEKSEGVKQIASVAAFQNGKLLFGLRRDNKRWSLPGGHLEAGESPTKAAVRELMEEANLKPLTLEYLGSGEVPGHEIHAFKADVVGTPAADLDPDEEFSSFLWVDPDNIPPEVQNNLHSPKNVTLQLLGIQKSSMPLNKAEDDEENEVDRLLENPRPGERMLALKLNSAQPRHYLKALEDGNTDVRRVAIDQAEKTGHIRPVIDKLFQMSTSNPDMKDVATAAAVDYVLYTSSLRKYIEPENLRTLYKNNPNWGSKLVEREFDTPPDVLHDILNNDPYNAQYVLNHPNAPESLFTQVGEDPNKWNSHVVVSAFRSPKMPQKYIESALRNVYADPETAQAAVQNPNVPEHAAHELFTRALVNRENRGVSDVRKIYLQTHTNNIPEKFLDLAIDDPDIDVVNSTLQSPLVNNHHIKRLIDRGLRENNPSLVSGALYHTSAKPEDLTKALKEGSPDIQRMAIRYANKAIVQPEHIEHALRSPYQHTQIAASDRLMGHDGMPFNPEYAHALVENPDADPSLLPNFAPKDSSDPSFFDKALNHPNERIRWAAAEAPQLTPEQVEKVSTMGDREAGNPRGPVIAAQHPNASPELLQRLHAQYPAEEDIQSHIAANPRTPEHILKGMVDDPKYAGDVLQNKGLKPEFIHGLTQTHPKWKSLYAIHPNTAPHTLEDIYNKDPLQRIAILRNQNTPSNLVHRALVEAPTQEPVTGRTPTEFAKAALAHRNVSIETLKEIGNNEKKYGGFTAEKARDKLARLDPDLVHDESVGIRFGQTQNLNKLRKVRDWIQSQGVEEVHQKKLPPGDYKAVQHNGKVSAQSIDNYINSHEPVKYNVSHSQWNGAQRHDRQTSKVFQLNLTTDQVNKMKAAGVKDFFDDIHASSRYSGHPVTPTTIGWVRYTDTNPESPQKEENKPSVASDHKEHGVFIDEIQSDLGQSLVKQIHKQAKQAGHSDEAAQKAAEDSKQKLDTIHKIVFQGRQPSEVLGEGFLQHLRDKGLHDKPVHIHTPESKAPISLGNQTKDVPVHFKETYKEWPKKSGMEPSQYGDLPTQTNEKMKGQPTQGGLVRKYEEDLDTFLKSQNLSQISPDSELIQDILGFNPSSSKIFDAARFLSGNTTVSLDKFRQALYEEDDLPSAALKAFGLEITPDNLKALESIQSIQHLNKNEQPCTAQSVVAGTSSGKDVAEQLKASFKDHFVVPVTLGGKHSAGSMLARDNEKATTWLLKPGVGGSPAAGVDEEPAPQATREAAFYAIAKAWGLGNDIPRTELMIIDGTQYAVIELLPWNYRNLDKLDKQSVGQARKILEPYRISGQLYKWAILDYVLGNADSHLQNTLASPEGKVYLIDHGSAFAGLEFDPAVDKNSFVPGYLRAWAPKAFHRLPIAEKLKYLPSVPEDAERGLRAFLGALDAKVLEGLLVQYSIGTKATLLRLAKLKFVASSMPVWQAIQKLWVIPL